MKAVSMEIILNQFNNNSTEDSAMSSFLFQKITTIGGINHGKCI